MIVIIFIILIIFVVALAAAWVWYIKSEMTKEPDLLSLAKAAFQKNDFKNAESFLVNFLVSQPNSEEGRQLLGTTYTELKNYEKAKGCFDKILKVSPKNSAALIGMAVMLENQQSYEESKEFYQKASQENPQNTKVYHNIGMLNFKQGNYQEAMEGFKKVLEADPDNLEAAFCITKCKTEIGRAHV